MSSPVPPPSEKLDKALLRQIKADKETIDFLGTLSDFKDSNWVAIITFYINRVSENLAKLRNFLQP